MHNRQTRRRYLLALGAASTVGLAGCSFGDSSQQQTATEAPTSNLGGANFSFEYVTSDQQAIIEFNGGAEILAGDLQIRSSTGLQVEWAELGSAIAAPDERISTGATAIIGPNILNWGQPVGRDETIRLVHVGQETPATLGRFTPQESSTLTSTVPPTNTPTATPTEEPSEEPTETPTEELDTTAPSITAFSLSNPSGQELRTSFESDENLASIGVRINGPEGVVLTTVDFSESVSRGSYTYEATYQASSDGNYTATLIEAADESENDGASEQSVSITVRSQETSISSPWPMYQYDAANTGVSSGTLAPTAGNVDWTYSVDGEIDSTPIVVNESVIFEGPSNVLHAVDPDNGTELWTHDVGTDIGDLTYSDGRLYFGDDDGQLTALSVNGDDELWTQDIASSAAKVSAVVGSKVLFATEAGVVAVSASSGEILWESSEGSRFAVDDQTVYTSNNDGIVALSLEDGSKQWEYVSSDGYRLSKLPTVGEMNVFVGSEGGDLFAIDKESGEHNWDAQPGSDVLRRSVAYADGTVYFGPNNERFYALDATTGEELWSFSDDLPDEYINHDWSAPSVVDGNVYTGYHTGIIFGFDAETGNELWRVETGDYIQGSSPVIVDGVLFIGCKDGNLYAIN